MPDLDVTDPELDDWWGSGRPRPVSTRELGELVAVLRFDLGPFCAAYRAAIDELTATVGTFHRALVDAGVVPDETPTEPKARALHLVRHRNTGPTVGPPGARTPKGR